MLDKRDRRFATSKTRTMLLPIILLCLNIILITTDAEDMKKSTPVPTPSRASYEDSDSDSDEYDYSGDGGSEEGIGEAEAPQDLEHILSGGRTGLENLELPVEPQTFLTLRKSETDTPISLRTIPLQEDEAILDTNHLADFLIQQKQLQITKSNQDIDNEIRLITLATFHKAQILHQQMIHQVSSLLGQECSGKMPWSTTRNERIPSSVNPLTELDSEACVALKNSLDQNLIELENVILLNKNFREESNLRRKETEVFYQSYNEALRTTLGSLPRTRTGNENKSGIDELLQNVYQSRAESPLHKIDATDAGSVVSKTESTTKSHPQTETLNESRNDKESNDDSYLDATTSNKFPNPAIFDQFVIPRSTIPKNRNSSNNPSSSLTNNKENEVTTDNLITTRPTGTTTIDQPRPTNENQKHTNKALYEYLVPGQSPQIVPTQNESSQSANNNSRNLKAPNPALFHRLVVPNQIPAPGSRNNQNVLNQELITPSPTQGDSTKTNDGDKITKAPPDAPKKDDYNSDDDESSNYENDDENEIDADMEMDQYLNVTTEFQSSVPNSKTWLTKYLERIDLITNPTEQLELYRGAVNAIRSSGVSHNPKLFKLAAHIRNSRMLQASKRMLKQYFPYQVQSAIWANEIRLETTVDSKSYFLIANNHNQIGTKISKINSTTATSNDNQNLSSVLSSNWKYHDMWKFIPLRDGDSFALFNNDTKSALNLAYEEDEVGGQLKPVISLVSVENKIVSELPESFGWKLEMVCDRRIVEEIVKEKKALREIGLVENDDKVDQLIKFLAANSEKKELPDNLCPRMAWVITLDNAWKNDLALEVNFSGTVYLGQKGHSGRFRIVRTTKDKQ